MNKIQINDIDIFIGSGIRASWDLSIAECVIEHDEYEITPFINSDRNRDVKCVVDIGANIGTFSLLASNIFPNARIISIEPYVKNIELLKANCGDNPNITIIESAVLGDGCPEEVTLGAKHINCGESCVIEANEKIGRKVVSDELLKIPCKSIDAVLTKCGVDEIGILKVDAEGSEVEIFECLRSHGWLEKTGWIRFEWHSRKIISRLYELLGQTHIVSIDTDNLCNALGIAHRKDKC
jgi:FkbM family methyltransferase